MVMAYFRWYLTIKNNSLKIKGYFRRFRVANENRVTFGGNDLAIENFKTVENYLALVSAACA
jgi:hypothetical protein